MTRLLVLVPHPDDEVVGCAVALRRVVAEGGQAFALYLTTGVPSAEVLWPWERHGHAAQVAHRRAEAEAAAKKLSLKPLGFQSWPSRRLKDHLDEALALVRGAVSEHAIDEVWVPAWEGAHQDHDVANFLAARLGGACAVREFAEYNFADGRVRSGEFPIANGTEQVINLSPEEQAWKRGLLDGYASERENLAHCRVDCESLRPLARHDYARPPHVGRLFHERFQWVPFRHPRIDFEPSSMVRAALARSQRR